MTDAKTYIINSTKSYSDFDAKNFADFEEHKYLVITVKFGRDRTAEQNKMMFEIYKRISKHLGESIQDIRSECKLLIGVPILYNEDEKFRAGWDRYFKNEPYHIQLHLMGPNHLLGPNGYPVTRLMSRKQGSQYIDGIMAKYPQIDFSELS